MIAPEGIPFLLAGAALALACTLWWPKSLPVSLAALLLTAFVAWFFRNPVRTPPSMPGSVISPADGTIVFSGESPPGRYFAEPGKKVSVFMSIFDVHVNRAPVSGKVLSVQYHPGTFRVASVDKASLENEQNGVRIGTDDGREVAYVQIAGLVARRVVCDLAEGDRVLQGQRVGLIRFGSRVDILMPASTEIRVPPPAPDRVGGPSVGPLTADPAPGTMPS